MVRLFKPLPKIQQGEQSLSPSELLLSEDFSNDSHSSISSSGSSKLILSEGSSVKYLTEGSGVWREGTISSIDVDDDGSIFWDVKLVDGRIEEVERDSEYVDVYVPKFPVTHKYSQVKEKYEIVRNIGFGTTSQVKLVKRKCDGQMFAMKQIKKKRLSLDESEQIERELTFLQHADHPNIVKMEEYYVTKSFICIILEHLKGGQLFDHIVQQSFSEFEAAKITKQLLSGLSYMHSSGYAHRDLKPNNIILVGNEELEVKIIDFGYLGTQRTGMETILGSPQFLAPEIILQTSYSCTVDVWACGVVLYMLLCGVPPFFSNNCPDLFEQILQKPLTFPDAPKLSSEVQDLLKQMLSKEPQQRPGACALLNHKWFDNASPTFFSLGHQNNLRKLTLLMKLRRGIKAILAVHRLIELLES